MTVFVDHLTNGAHGANRNVAPIALACIHICGNTNTAKMADHDGALAERSYANRPGSTGPSAHYYVARSGWAVEAIDPDLYWAWSNGDSKSPNLANPGVVKALHLAASLDVNLNRAYWLEIENVGDDGAYPVTADQKQACAELIAAMSTKTGLPINRSTVQGHWEINGIDRQLCPSPQAQHESFLNDIIARANALLAPAEVETMDITSTTPLLVSAPIGTQMYALDGKTPVFKLSTAIVDRRSEYAVGDKRAVVLSHADGTRYLSLIVPASTKPVPVPKTQADIDAAVAPLKAANTVLTIRVNDIKKKVAASAADIADD